MSAIETLRLKALAAVREVCLSLEFGEQAHEAIEDGAFKAGVDTEIESSQGSLFTAKSLLDEMSELLDEMAKGVAS